MKGLVSARRTPGGKRMFIRSDIPSAVLHSDCPEIGIFARGDPHSTQAIAAGAHPYQARLGKDQSRGFEPISTPASPCSSGCSDRLDGCIGCGCLSLEACKLYNPGDRMQTDRHRPRLVLQKSIPAN
jgi:MerR family redox-sensitive transcriptional activator SoxR